MLSSPSTDTLLTLSPPHPGYRPLVSRPLGPMSLSPASSLTSSICCVWQRTCFKVVIEIPSSSAASHCGRPNRSATVSKFRSIGDRPFVIGPLQRGNSFTPLPRMSLSVLLFSCSPGPRAPSFQGTFAISSKVQLSPFYYSGFWMSVTLTKMAPQIYFFSRNLLF